MRIYYDEERTPLEARLFPYSAANAEQSGHVDFKTNPELIESALEDFRRAADKKAIQTFYSFLRWINGPESHLESNDSALRMPAAHQNDISTKKLCVYGRVIILYRDLRLNCFSQQSEWLCGKLMHILKGTDVEFTGDEGVVAFTRTRAIHTSLSNGVWQPNGSFECAAVDPGRGHHLMLSFWAYGDDETEVFCNLDRVFTNIWKACENLSAEITEGIRAYHQAHPSAG